jgi:ABC-type transport system involved in multi-copper enzyme maturation permease subunit
LDPDSRTQLRGRPPFGPGPVFVYECLTAARRWQGYAARSLFVLLLLAALVVTYRASPELRQAGTLRTLARFGEQLYVAVVGTELTLVLLAAPAATAGAICLDRARGTLSHLLLTDLTDGEIVLGKLAARLVPVIGLIACTLPVMALLTLLGGIDPDALLQATLLILGTALLGSSLALCFSLWATRTHEALLGTYAVWCLWLLSAPMLNRLAWLAGGSFPVFHIACNPYVLAFAPYGAPGTVGWGAFGAFFAITAGLSTLLAALAVIRLRPVCRREPGAGARPRKGRRAYWWESGRFKTLFVDRWPRIIRGPSLDRNPVSWREWHRGRPSRWARVVQRGFIAVALVFSILAALPGSNPGMAAWVNGMQVSVGLLLLSVSAATSLAEERARGSLDVLMASPLPTRQIVVGKWLGTFRQVPALAILPTYVIVNIGLRQDPPEMLLVWSMTVAFILLAGATITSLGVALATWCSRLGRAVGLTVTLYVMMAVGWLFLMMMLPLGHPHTEGPMMGSPFFFVGELTFELADKIPPKVGTRAWGVIWLVSYGAVAGALLLATLSTFNRCLGRVDVPYRLPAVIPRKPSRPIHALAEPVEGA